MSKYFIAGVGNAQFLDSMGNVVIDATALTDSGFNISTNKEEIRGGQGAALQGQFYHTSGFSVNLKNALADLNYIALQVGGNITKGGDVFRTETVTAEENSITVIGTPKAYGNYGTIGWYTHEGSSEKKTVIKFNDKKATATGVKAGERLCVTYVATSDTARVFEVATSYVPSIGHLVLTMPLYRAGDNGKVNLSTDSQVGNYIVDIPSFQLDGNLDLSTTMTGSSPMNLSGMALQSGTSGCSGKGIYARITEDIFEADRYEAVRAIVVEDSDIDLKNTEKQVIRVMALYNDGTCPSLLDNKDLTFNIASNQQTIASVDVKGEVTAKSAGSATVDIKVTKHPELTACATVTVA